MYTNTNYTLILTQEQDEDSGYQRAEVVITTRPVQSSTNVPQDESDITERLRKCL